MNKQGDEKLFSIWWYLIILFVAAGIVLGVLAVYSSDLDIRKGEAEILSERIANCLIKNSLLREDFLQSPSTFDFYSNCNLKKEVFENGFNFYFEVEIEKLNFQFSSLISSELKTECEMAEAGIFNKDFPVCVERQESFYYFDEQKKEATLRILAGSNSRGKNVDED